MKIELSFLLVFLCGCGASPSDAKAIARLEERIAALEATIEMAQGRKPDEIISAKGFVITDHDGKIRARLGFDRLNKMDGIPGLFVYDDFGTKRVAVIETSYGAGVAVYDHKGRPRCSLTYNNAMEVRSGVDATSGRGRELGNINSPIVDYLVCFPQTADRQPKKIFLKPGQADLPPAN